MSLAAALLARWKFINGSAQVVVLNPIEVNPVSYGPVQILGSLDSPYPLTASEAVITGFVDLRNLSQMRSLWIEITTGSGTVTVDVEPAIDSSGKVLGGSFALTASAEAASTIIDIPLTLLPYTPFGRFTITETAAATVSVNIFMMGRGGV
jgi:hypothetical protein